MRHFTFHKLHWLCIYLSAEAQTPCLTLHPSICWGRNTLLALTTGKSTVRVFNVLIDTKVLHTKVAISIPNSRLTPAASPLLVWIDEMPICIATRLGPNFFSHTFLNCSTLCVRANYKGRARVLLRGPRWPDPSFSGSVQTFAFGVGWLVHAPLAQLRAFWFALKRGSTRSMASASH